MTNKELFESLQFEIGSKAEILKMYQISCDTFGYTPDQMRMFDIPDAYAVVSDEAEKYKGILIYGYYNGRWVVNPKARYLVQYLLNLLSSYEDEDTVGQPNHG